MRLLYTEQCGPGPFRQLFDDVRPLYTVHRDTVGKDDVIMFGGGTDIDPKLYGELPNRYTQHADVERDKLEKAVFDLLKDKVRGFLGICRGSQYLTVLSGGKLIQDVGLMHGKYHNIVDTRTGETYYASSTHHQMMRPWVLPAGDYEIIAQAATKLSFSYHGEPGKEYKDEEIPCEPEVVWYPKTRCLGIQGHPEYMKDGNDYAEYCARIVKEKLLNG